MKSLTLTFGRAHTYALAEVYGVHMDDKIVTLKVKVVECGVTTE